MIFFLYPVPTPDNSYIGDARVREIVGADAPSHATHGGGKAACVYVYLHAPMPAAGTRRVVTGWRRGPAQRERPVSCRRRAAGPPSLRAADSKSSVLQNGSCTVVRPLVSIRSAIVIQPHGHTYHRRRPR